LARDALIGAVLADQHDEWTAATSAWMSWPAAARPEKAEEVTLTALTA
jgi:hypothetical protein